MKPGTSSGDSSIVLQAADLWKSYDEGTVAVLKGVDCLVRSGETVALCGPSGCGKSTLLHLFGGLDQPDRGCVTGSYRPKSLNRTNVQIA